MGRITTIKVIACCVLMSCNKEQESKVMVAETPNYDAIGRDYFDKLLKTRNPLGYDLMFEEIKGDFDFNKDGISDNIVAIAPMGISNSGGKKGRYRGSLYVLSEKRQHSLKPVLIKTASYFNKPNAKNTSVIFFKGDTLIMRNDKEPSYYTQKMKLIYKGEKLKIHSIEESRKPHMNEGTEWRSVNFSTKEGFRKYVIADTSPLFNISTEEEQCTYKMFFAEKNEKIAQEQLRHEISKSQYITYKRENWVGEKDLSFTTSTTWDNEFIYMLVDVTDDKVILNSGENIIYGDHIEFWLDFSNERTTKPKHDVFLKGSRFKYYRTIRNEPDSTLVQGIIGLNQSDINSSSVIINRKENTNISVESKHRLTDTGYSVEAKIPLNQLGKEIFNIDLDYRYTNELGFTVVVSDTDDTKTKKQETLMATSTLKHGNPFTLGSLFLIDKFEMPVYQSWSKCSNEIQYQYGFPRR